MNKNTLVRFLKLSILLTILIFTLSCEKDSENVSSDLDFKYPLTVGNSWTYELSFIDDFDSLAESNGYSDDTLSYSASVEIVSNEVIFDSIEVFNLRIIEEVYNGVYETNEYYNNVDNKFVNYGYTSGSMISPKIDQKNDRIVFHGRIFNNTQELSRWIDLGFKTNTFSKDSIYRDSVNVLMYPLEKDKEWVYREENQPFGIHKKLIGTEIVSTSAGDFNCWKIQWIYTDSLMQNIEFFDYISQDGLVRRILKSKFYIADEFGEIMGTSDFIEEKILVDHLVK